MRGSTSAGDLAREGFQNHNSGMEPGVLEPFWFYPRIRASSSMTRLLEPFTPRCELSSASSRAAGQPTPSPPTATAARSKTATAKKTIAITIGSSCPGQLKSHRLASVSFLPCCGPGVFAADQGPLMPILVRLRKTCLSLPGFGHQLPEPVGGAPTRLVDRRVDGGDERALQTRRSVRAEAFAAERD